MNERLRHQLLPEVQQALRDVQKFTGKEPLIKQVDSLPRNVRAMLKRPLRPNCPYEILFRKCEDAVISHLITHELGHIIRIHRVPPDERQIMAVHLKHRMHAARQIQDELLPLLELGFSSDQLGEMMIDWHEALVEQIGNGPVDIRIEQWIFDRFPGLRRVQQASLVDEVKRGFEAFHPLVRQIVPASIYCPTLAMNAAQAWHVAELYKRPDLLQLYDLHQYTGLGKHLARIVIDAPDEGHKNDMAAINCWAQEMRLTGWFEWQQFPLI